MNLQNASETAFLRTREVTVKDVANMFAEKGENEGLDNVLATFNDAIVGGTNPYFSDSFKRAVQVLPRDIREALVSNIPARDRKNANNTLGLSDAAGRSEKARDRLKAKREAKMSVNMKAKMSVNMKAKRGA